MHEFVLTRRKKKGLKWLPPKKRTKNNKQDRAVFSNRLYTTIRILKQVNILLGEKNLKDSLC